MEMLTLAPELGYGKDYLECISLRTVPAKGEPKRDNGAPKDCIFFTLSIYGPPLENDSRCDLKFSQYMDVFLQ